MRVGSIVKSNVDYQIGIITEVQRRSEPALPKYRVLFPDEKPMWLSKNVLDLICE
jgi:hypothetical protein